MKNKLRIIFLFISIVGNIATLKIEPQKIKTIKGDGTQKFDHESIMEIEENQLNGMECAIHSNSLNNFIIEYQQTFHSLSLSCKLSLKTLANNLKIFIDNTIKYKISEYMKNIERMRLQLIDVNKINNEGLENECSENNYTEIINEKNKIIMEILISLIRNGENNGAHQVLLNLPKFNLSSLITTVYDNQIIYAEKLIIFLNSLSTNQEVLRGYHLLFDQMAKNQQIYSTPISMMAYRIFGDFNKCCNTDEHFLYLHKNLPKILNNFMWKQSIVVRNLRFHSTIWHNNHINHVHDELRLIPILHTSTTNEQRQRLTFIPIDNGTYFHIFIVPYEGYLYVENDDFILNGQRRAVFMWRKPREIKETGKWQIETINDSDSFKIKNLYYNQYLSVADGVYMKDSHYLKLFTVTGDRCDDRCKWDIIKFTG